MNIVLWIIQVLLALVFLFAGGTKLVLPLEVLGALGLILLGLLRIRTSLAPRAATGLVIIMIGATVLTLIGDGVGASVVPLVTVLLAAFVAYGRWRLAPLSGRTGRNQ